MSSNALPRKRTKTFTGCWTCRARRVKCDEGKPFCQRCADSSKLCEGYGTRLVWDEKGSRTKGQTDSVQRVPRSRRPIAKQAEPLVSLAPTSPTSLDGRATILPSSLKTKGKEINEPLFSVFRCRSNAKESNGESSASSNGQPFTSPPPNLSIDSTQQTDSITHTSESGHIASDSEHDLPGTSASIVDYHDGAARDGLSVNPEDDVEEDASSTHHLTDRLDTKSPDTHMGTEHEMLFDHNYQPAIRDPPMYTHLDLLILPGRQKRLIHHFVAFLSQKLLLLDLPNNPCQTLMLPMALSGLMTSSKITSPAIAMFHTICACSAYNLFELSDRKSNADRTLALQHDQLSITHLRLNLNRNLNSGPDCQYVAIIITACFSIEAMSAHPRRWRTHVAGALSYLQNGLSQHLYDNKALPFKQSILCIAILSDISFPSDLTSCLIDIDDSDTADPLFCFPGLTAQLACSIVSINRMIDSPTQIHSEREMEQFELQLYLGFPPFRTRHVDPLHDAVLHCMEKTFYYAILVYFQRSVRYQSADSVQTLVELGITELEKIEKLTSGNSGCAVMWPVLILAAECTTQALQSRTRVWFMNKQKLGMRNIEKLCEIATLVWQRRLNRSENRSEDDTWQSVIKDDEQLDVYRL